MQKMSDKGRKLLQQWEGIRKVMYLDSVGLPTIGCGHLLTKSELYSGKILVSGAPVKFREGLNESQIDILLSQDLTTVNSALNTGINVELTQNQFDALCSFAFNVGIPAFLSSTLRRLLNKGEIDSIPFQLRRWNIAGGKISNGLINRREHEIKLFTEV